MTEVYAVYNLSGWKVQRAWCQYFALVSLALSQHGGEVEREIATGRRAKQMRWTYFYSLLS